MGATLLLLAGRPAVAQPAHSANSKIDRSVQESLRSGAATARVIITVDDPALRAGIRQSLQAHGDVIKADHPLVGAFSAEIHSDDVPLLANHPGVRAISADAFVRASAAPQSTRGSRNNGGRTAAAGTALAGTWLTSTLRPTLGLAPVATSGPTGHGIGVALIDSGITPSEDFEGRIIGSFDFTHGGIAALPYDDYGHGTHVAGLIGSSGVLSDYKLQGIAPRVNFVVLKVLDRNGQGTTSDVIKAIEYVTANFKHLHVQIVNLSLGHPIFAPAADDPLVQAVERATAAGLVVVASVGNAGQNLKTGLEGYGGVTSPGNAPSVITSGAAMTGDTVQRDDDRVAPYSSRGPTWYDGLVKPDLVAPGNQLISDTNPNSSLFKLLKASQHKDPNGHEFLQLSGTSMAAAVTTGVVALVLEANLAAHYVGATPLTANAVKAILQYSALAIHDDNGVAYDVLTQGAGEINALGAITLGSAIDTSAKAGTWWLRNLVPTHTSIGGLAYSWAQNIVWGDNVVWGDLVFHQLAAWSENIVWGDHIVWGQLAQVKAGNIVWGDSLVWSTNIVWGNRLIGMAEGDNIVWGNAAAPGNTDNIVWGNLNEDNIVWGNLFNDNIVWGNSDDDHGGDNIVWGNTVYGLPPAAGRIF